MVGNSDLIEEGVADQIVERFAETRGHVEGFPGFVSMEVLCSEGADEMLATTRRRDKDTFNSWVQQ